MSKENNKRPGVCTCITYATANVYVAVELHSNRTAMQVGHKSPAIANYTSSSSPVPSPCSGMDHQQQLRTQLLHPNGNANETGEP